MSDEELLRRFASEGSDDAFADLVARHLNWVYSVALRQLNGDSSAASDVSQRVFIDLAAKAHQLDSHTSLAGWLHTSTRFEVNHHLRREQRRRGREKRILIVNQIPDLAPNNPPWEEIRPLLDDCLSQLDVADREALLWRFFERLSHADIGRRLGSTENAARMRVDRALDRLRSKLASRGVISTISALGTVLGQNSVSNAPINLGVQICVDVREQRVGVGTATKVGSRLPRPIVPAGLIALTAMLIAFLGLVRLAHDKKRLTLPSDSHDQIAQVELSPSWTGTGSNIGASDPLSAQAVFRLTVIGATDGRPLPALSVDALVEADDDSKRFEVVTGPDGRCEVPLPENPSVVQLTTQADGWATTRLTWRPPNGELVPTEFTVTLEPSVHLGGLVIDSEGQPVPGAHIQFRQQANFTQNRRPISHEFGMLETTTNPDGRWTLNRMGSDMVRNSQLVVDHPNHPSSGVWIHRDKPAETALLKGNHVVRLSPGTEISGLVVDGNERPISGASVTLGILNDPRFPAETQTTGEGGAFVLKGCRRGNRLLTAVAPGFAPNTLRISVTPENTQFRIKLEPSRALRLKLVTADGTPIEGGLASLDTFDANHYDSGSQPPPQVWLRLRSGPDGQMTWNEAPDRELVFQVEAKGFRSTTMGQIRPSEKTHTLVLHPAVTVTGRVRNADTGELIPRFSVSVGSPEATFDGVRVVTNLVWSSRERFGESFSGGQFQLSLTEPVVSESPEAGYYVRIAAEGFAPFTSRWISTQEGLIQLDASLKPTPGIVLAVTSPQGSLVTGADVAILRSGAQAILDGFALYSGNERAGVVQHQTDQLGQVSLTWEDPSTRIVIVHPSGYLDLSAELASSQRTWRLQSWAKIQGYLESNATPLAGVRLALFGRGGLHDPVRFDSRRFQTLTDAEGRFGFESVPPGPLKLVILHPITLHQGTNAWRHGEELELEAEPGKTTPVHWKTTRRNASL
ncbi:MAG: sigma-70 family RNA polymerase sigma factor [Verrucomicrobia bacterium]|nr:sigma-70 family RNA polymerase sigma factor [Verrucomicrobiota bacterium]